MGKRFGVIEKSLGRWGDKHCGEKSGRNEEKIMQTLYIEIPIYRWIEKCRKLSKIKKVRNSYREGIKQLSKGVHSKRGSINREAIEHLSSIQKLPQWIEWLLRSYWDWISRISTISMDSQWIEFAITAIEKRSSRGLIDTLAVERYWETVEIA